MPTHTPYSSKADALSVLDRFARGTAAGAWPALDRLVVCNDLYKRVNDPNRIDQADAPFCGPAAVMRTLALDDPVAYVRAAAELFDTGATTVYDLTIDPGRRLRSWPVGMGLSQADWLMLGGLRESGNTALSVTDPVVGSTAAGYTHPDTLDGWFRGLGYNVTRKEAHMSAVTRPNPFGLRGVAARAGQLFDRGFWVALLINSNMLYASRQDSGSLLATHWVVLTDRLPVGVVDGPGEVVTKVYSWAAESSVPEVHSQPLTTHHFLNNFYGYVAAKWEP